LQLDYLNKIVSLAVKNNCDTSEIERIQTEWHEEAKLCTFGEAVAEELRKRGRESQIQEWLVRCADLSHRDACILAKHLLGTDLFWCWDRPRTREGYYHFKCGVEAGIARGVAFAPFSDLIWLETKDPNFNQAKQFAEGVHKKYPLAMLAYNLSPSFNWDAAGMTDEEISSYIRRLAALGFVWQFITLGGFHTNSLAVDTFAQDYNQRGMLAYVEQIQRKERAQTVETLTHQKWSGATFVDSLVRAVCNTSSTLSMGNGVTETQFSESKL